MGQSAVMFMDTVRRGSLLTLLAGCVFLQSGCAVPQSNPPGKAEAVSRRQYYLKSNPGLPDHIKAEILGGSFDVGMNEEEVTASLGHPDGGINTTVVGSHTHEQWIYGTSFYLYFDDGILTSYQQ